MNCNYVTVIHNNIVALSDRFHLINSKFGITGLKLRKHSIL